MKSLFCIAALTAALGLAASHAALADQTGNVNFTGTVTSNTCILSGQNITHDIGAFTNTGPWATTPV
ncbi:hypothetical protein E0L31_026205, partial [Serratia marcescens]|nr:hypothetical protein [Serratia marcescens]